VGERGEGGAGNRTPMKRSEGVCEVCGGKGGVSGLRDLMQDGSVSMSDMTEEIR
jgi:hypothetical protein